jgi:cell wall-associated NlpC family hydrolase
MLRENIVKTALNEAIIGTRYISQGQTLGSHLDCTGFVYAVFKENGYEFEYDNTLTEAYDGSIIKAIDTVLKPTDQPLPGDIIAFEQNSEVFHVAIYLSSRQLGTFVHTNNIANKVIIDNFAESNFWRRYFYGYYSIKPLLCS